MRIVHIAAEMAPIAKIGGLADVVYGLSRETLQRGHPTSVIIPKFDILELDGIQNFTRTTDHFTIEFDHQEWQNSVWTGIVDGLQVYFIEAQHPYHYFSRGCIYGCDDDVDRFLYFSKAALQFVKEKESFDLIHIHDWQTAAIAPLAKEDGRYPNTKIPPLIFTIHNMDYQGRCSPSALEKVGLGLEKYYTPELMQDSLYPEAINLMKGGIFFSDSVTTVSPTYAHEVKETSLGEGLEDLLAQNHCKFSGILNGIDYDYWNPETDPYLPCAYSSNEYLENASNSHTVDRKGYVKKALRERLMLDDVRRPIVGIIARLIPQKGVDIIKHAMKSVIEKGGQFVLLGSSPIAELNDEFHRLKHEYADNPHISLTLQHQELLAHLIFAGSDIFMVPSNFEPCGLTQMIALRYGTIPIVRETGGLKDSIFDVDHDAATPEKAGGYTFSSPTNESFDQALDRAFQCWHREPERWRKMIINGMNHDFSWKKSAGKYLEIYQSLISYQP